MTDLEIFHDAPADATPEELVAYLDTACGGDGKLRARVEALFERREKDPTDDFLEDPPVPETATSAARLAAVAEAITEKEGDVVGPYTLKEKLGEGGFGIVWLAEQTTPIARKVALKVIKAGMDTREVLARFEAERQALAMMSHPNIARVFDAGATENGRPWFAMERVRGVPITQYCDAERLDTRQRLALIRDICAAVNHAHQKGVIHRDLKPSNLMVTVGDSGDESAGIVKVIDFGVAKAVEDKLTEETLVTRIEQFLGTPAYMSPEQAAMNGIDVDTRSDIYSLGVILYELLAGAPPFEHQALISAGYDEMRRIICEVEPPRPSSKVTTVAGDRSERIAATHGAGPQQLGRLLKGDLDWIVMKAIEKDRSRRYEAASAFAADVGRFLSDEPVLAAAPSAAYRFRKFVRRNQRALLVGALFLFVTVTSAVLIGQQMSRANHLEEQVEQLLEKSDAGSSEEAEAIDDFVLQIERSGNPDARRTAAVRALDRVVEKLESDETIDPEKRTQQLATLGLTYSELGLHREALRLKTQVLDDYRNRHGLEDRKTLHAMTALAGAYRAAGRHEKEDALREEQVKIRRAILDRQLAAGKSDSEAVKAMSKLAASFKEAGQYDDAIELGEKVLKIKREIHGERDISTIFAMTGLANSYSRAGRSGQALRIRGEALRLAQDHLGRSHPKTVEILLSLAGSWRSEGAYEKAIALGEEGLKLRRDSPEPNRSKIDRAMIALARSYRGAGNHEQALTLFEESLRFHLSVRDSKHPKTLWHINRLANYYVELGNHERAGQLRNGFDETGESDSPSEPAQGSGGRVKFPQSEKE